jgi:hypothetical protein
VAVQDLAYVLATGYVAVSILLGGFYIRISEIKLAPLKWLSNLSYPLFTMQGLAHLELSGIRYRPAGCIAAGMPGATDAELNTVGWPTHLAHLQNNLKVLRLFKLRGRTVTVLLTGFVDNHSRGWRWCERVSKRNQHRIP